MRKILFAALVLQLGACKQQSNVQQQPGELIASRPNIILIMADDVAPENLASYGGHIPTPNLDKLADGGMRFNRAYCVSAACTPSRYAILTGTYPGRCDHPEFMDENPKEKPYNIEWNTPLQEESNTIHKELKKQGYYTGFVGKFHVGELDFDMPSKNPAIPEIAEGAEISKGNETDSLLTAYQQVIAQKTRELVGCDFIKNIQWENPEELPIEEIRVHHLEWITEGVESFFKDVDNNKPFFLHINTTALHGPNHYDNLKQNPHHVPDGYMENPYEHHPARETVFNRLDSLNIPHGREVPDYINHYSSGIIYMDDQVGAIMEILKEYDVDENTLIIFTADHGLEPGKSTCYEYGVRVPFIANWKNVIPEGTVSKAMVQFTDFMPTFTALAGQEIKLDGKNITPAFRGSNSLDNHILYMEMGYLRAVVNQDFKYIAMRFPEETLGKLKSGEQDMITHFGARRQGHAFIAMEYHPHYFDANQLYYLPEDGYEQNNVYSKAEYQEEVALLKSALDSITSTFKHPYPFNEDDFDRQPYYQQAANRAKQIGTNAIPWWDRQLDYPPAAKRKLPE